MSWHNYASGKLPDGSRIFVAEIKAEEDFKKQEQTGLDLLFAKDY
jgi:hypothetical protein